MLLQQLLHFCLCSPLVVQRDGISQILSWPVEVGAVIKGGPILANGAAALPDGQFVACWERGFVVFAAAAAAAALSVSRVNCATWRRDLQEEVFGGKLVCQRRLMDEARAGCGRYGLVIGSLDDIFRFLARCCHCISLHDHVSMQVVAASQLDGGFHITNVLLCLTAVLPSLSLVLGSLGQPGQDQSAVEQSHCCHKVCVVGFGKKKKRCNVSLPSFDVTKIGCQPDPAAVVVGPADVVRKLDLLQWCDVE
mmetsp:Transcript_1117/g.3257  ORF Transcript_1117/g.3257 Transcript_1117/m.3257 type:complete len:251 (-) Transcript_1117:381-1133(-)